eukprot:TRINITY_DN239_c0_g1_i5.p1 TRINITY_DN239_c0_g1~~TRINITY_DN239_c0_g1_i5.p1  ORF type:complete len:206 (-),score=99.66 TRINITY_DN239_c0_g1_i5:557-1129(-)
MSMQATLKWAQRADWVYIKIDLQDVKDAVVEYTKEGHFKFEGKVGDKTYTAETDLFGELDLEESHHAVMARSVSFALKKAEGVWWDRLCKESGKRRWVVTDWDRWADEDDDGYTEEVDTGMGGMDFASMMGGMGGMGGGGMPGGMDLASMMQNMGAGGPSGADDDDEDADADVDTAAADDEEMPSLEEVN